MISVEQVRALEERVEKAVAYISELKQESAGLKRELEEARNAAEQSVARAAELEAAAEAFRRDQASIEEGIVHALHKLDAFEDLVLKVGEQASRPETGTPPAREPYQPVRGTMESRTGPRLGVTGVAVKSAAEPVSAADAATMAGPAMQAGQVKDIDELSLEELEAATAPASTAAARPAEAKPAPASSQLDIF